MATKKITDLPLSEDVEGMKTLGVDKGGKSVQFPLGDKMVGRKTAEGGEVFNSPNNVASGLNSHAEGEYCQAFGHASHAEGNCVVARGDYSHAEGFSEDGMPETFNGKELSNATKEDVEAESSNSVSFTMAFGEGSHAEGVCCLALGTSSHAEGSNTIASGDWGSHSEGSNCIARGYYSHAEGSDTITTNAAEHAEGTYNASHTGTLSSIGMGEYTLDGPARKNAVEVMGDGRVFVKDLGGYDGTNPDTAQDVKTVIDGLIARIAALESKK